MNDPLKWERVPTVGTDLGVEVYRALIDGKGWLVTTLLTGQVADGSTFPVGVSIVFIPDENGMWGQ